MTTRRAFTVHVYADEIARLHELRAAAGLDAVSDEALVRLALRAGIASDLRDYKQMAETHQDTIQHCLDTCPPSMRGPEWHRANDHLRDMRERGVL